MCTNKYYQINPYTKKGLYVNCGKCSACQQEKAIHRVRRIKDTYTPQTECAMVTLTYSRRTAPYIDRSEAYNFSRGRLPYLNVYRDSSFRRVRVGSGYDFEYRSKSDKFLLDMVPYVHEVRFDKLKDLKYEQGKIGVAYYPDVQRFVARLRLNLKRLHNYDREFKTFCCSEYGSVSDRPHFHLLFFYQKGDFETLRSAIIESWPFSDLSKFDRAIEKCFRGASYVASYVNCGNSFPDFLKCYFRPKHSYSKGFGLGNAHFNLRYLKFCFDKASFTYPFVSDSSQSAVIETRLIPKYVIHRYFPKFKGYTRIDPVALFDVMQRLGRFDGDAVNKMISPLYLSDEEVYKSAVRLNNAYSRCNEEIPNIFPTFDDYWDAHIKVWNLYNSTLLRHQMENDDLPLYQHFDNLDEVKVKVDSGVMPLPDGLLYSQLDLSDPNKHSFNFLNTKKLKEDYFWSDKHRRVTNYVLSSLYEEF